MEPTVSPEADDPPHSASGAVDDRGVGAVPLGLGRPAPPAGPPSDALLDAASAGILAFDAAGLCVRSNRAAQRLLGRCRDGLLGRTVDELFPCPRDDPFAGFTVLPAGEGRATAVEYSARPWEGSGGAAGPSGTVVTLTDATARRSAEAEVEVARAEMDRQNRQLRGQARVLIEGELRMRSILDNSTALIYARDRQGRFLFVNPRCARLLGRTEAELLGLNSHDLFPAEMADPIVAHDEQVWRTAAEHTFEERVTVDGRALCTTSSRFPLTDASGRMVAVCGIATDITDRLAAEAELRAAKEAAERAGAAADVARELAQAASAAKSEFLANMSHELRTPLNGVIGMGELLLGTPLSAEQERFTRVLRTSADALLGVINQVLDFSKIEAGKLELEATDVDPSAVVGGVVQMLAHRAAAKGLTLTADVAPTVPQAVRGDPVRLRQILVNLVNNAVKFTDAGGVAIRLTAATAGGDPTDVELRFEVADTGPGIPANRIGHLFQSFSQVDASTTRRYGGTGLGLAISARLATLMGGRTGVESTVGVGSTFWFTAHVRPAVAPAASPAPMAATPPAVPGPAPLAGLRVLVAEDNDVNREVIGHLLKRMGCGPTIVEDGQAAVDAVSADPDAFDLVLMDCQMPVLDGFAAAREIRRREAGFGRGQPLPILALTASAVVGDRERCLAVGMDGYVTKPIHPAELRDAILALARPRR
jgi:PAS domain S-box-containing protein